MQVVYRIIKASYYQYFLPADPNNSKDLRATCLPRENWTPALMYNRMPLLKQGSFFQLDGGYLIVSENVLNELSGFFLDAGEILSLTCEDDDATYAYINILNCINCLDKAKTVWQEGFEGFLIEKHAFHANRLPRSGLFKIPETHSTEVLVHMDDRASSVNDFKYQVEKFQFKGIEFQELWRSEQDP